MRGFCASLAASWQPMGNCFPGLPQDYPSQTGPEKGRPRLL